MADHLLALEPGTLLDEYRIDRILGQGGFGITYLASDTRLSRQVALKEYLPREVATRDATRTVRPLSSGETTEFNWGLSRFVDEARVLAQLEHPNIVRVLRILEGHGTAYMVMRYEQGEELGQLLKAMSRQPSEEELVGVIRPILDALEKVHESGFLHRDVKPANIFLRDDGTPVLLDFGAARQAVREHSHSITSVASEGYAPYEQYSTDGRSQGPWTDLYGLAAVMYRVVTGQTPVGAQTRGAAIIEGKPDPLVPVEELVPPNTYSPALLNAITAGLSYRTVDRPQLVAAFRDLLEGTVEWEPPQVTPRVQLPDAASRRASGPISALSGRPSAPQSAIVTTTSKPTWLLPALLGTAVLVLAAGGGWLWLRDGGTGVGGGGSGGGKGTTIADAAISPDTISVMLRQTGQQMSVVRRSLGELRVLDAKIKSFEAILNPTEQMLTARHDMETKKRFYERDVQDQLNLYLARLAGLRNGEPGLVDAALDADQARADTMQDQRDVLLKMNAVLRRHVLAARAGGLNSADIVRDLSTQ